VAEQYIRTMREEMNAETRRFDHVPSGFVAEHKKIEEETLQTSEKGIAKLKRSDKFENGWLHSGMAPEEQESPMLNYSI